MGLGLDPALTRFLDRLLPPQRVADLKVLLDVDDLREESPVLLAELLVLQREVADHRSGAAPAAAEEHVVVRGRGLQQDEEGGPQSSSQGTIPGVARHTPGNWIVNV